MSVAIDDFGTGYSSLAYLTDLPIGELKIDKSFVRAMSSDSRNAIVVRSTIELAHNLGLRTVAEGIEDAFTFERLRALGCELAQGFHMSKPLPAAGLLNWWDDHIDAPTPSRRARAADAARPHRPPSERGLMLLVVTALALRRQRPARRRTPEPAGRHPRPRASGRCCSPPRSRSGSRRSPAAATGLHVALHVFSYVLDAYFLFANRRLAGVPLVAARRRAERAGDHQPTAA